MRISDIKTAFDLLFYFRYVADIARVMPVLTLVYKLHSLKTSKDVSFKTQVLYLIVFVTRYTDLFTRFISYYNTLLKIFYISSACYIVYLMRFKYRRTSDSAEDRVALWALALPCAILGAAISWYMFRTMFFSFHPFSPPFWVFTEGLWYFSIFLDAIAIIPQIYILRARRQLSDPGKESPVITTFYLAFSGRWLYFPSWIHRYIRYGILDIPPIAAALVEFALHAYAICLHLSKPSSAKEDYEAIPEKELGIEKGENENVHPAA
ncbi:hypothetical protein GYMLUDRAFT_220931 [Collybiopsis luxurians FD-317 M1]|nr:hypothetical protein GYMLUDRAFT_220931 [Collybiopsis luxurians FD-317 M1]